MATSLRKEAPAKKEAAPAVVAAAATTPAAKKIEAFFTRPSAKVQVSLWVTDVTTKGAPQFDGKLNGKPVAVWTRKAAKGNFLSIMKRVKTDKKDEAGKVIMGFEAVATGNIVVDAKGIPKLCINMVGEKDNTIWASIRKTTPQALLDASGFNADLVATKRAAAAASAAEAATAAPKEKTSKKPA